MRVLLDTHTLLWSAIDAPELSSAARTVLTDAQTVAVCSVASLWEISIKVALGKLGLAVPLAAFFDEVRTRFEVFPIEARHCLRYASLPLYHRDPFDRMLVAQALDDKLAVVSNDAAFDAYGITRIW